MIQWSSDLELGLPEIDTQHIEIFAVCARLNAAVPGGDSPAADDLAFLSRYVDEHFAMEQQLMKETDYPARAEHTLEHARYRGVMMTILKRPLTDPTLLSDLALSVTSWLLYHIQHEDLALAKHLKARAAGRQG